MTRFMLALAAGSMLVSGSAMAQSARAPGGFYVGGSLGTAVFWDYEEDDNEIEYDTFGFAFAGQVGYFLNDNIRLEAELAYESSEGEAEDGEGNNTDAEVSIVRGSISGYYDFNQLALGGMSGIRPYAGGGVGLAKLETEFDEIFEDADETEFTLHGEVGASFDLGTNVALVPATRLEYTDEQWVSLIKLGLRYAF